MQELEADGGIPRSMSTVSEILIQDLGMKHVVAKFIPWLLLPKQKEHRAAVANDSIETTTNEPDFFKVLTRDECGSIIMIQKGRPSHPNGRRLVLRAQKGTAKLQQDQNHVNCVF